MRAGRSWDTDEAGRHRLTICTLRAMPGKRGFMRVLASAIGIVAVLCLAPAIAIADPSVVTTTPGPSLATPELVASTPEDSLRGIGSDGGEGVWFSEVHYGIDQPTDVNYLTHYAPDEPGLTRIPVRAVRENEGIEAGIAPGASGEEWFSTGEADRVQEIKANGKIVNKRLPAALKGPPVGLIPDGQGGAWFSSVGGVGRLTPTGKLTALFPGAHTGDLAVGPDGNIWAAEYPDDYVAEASATTGASLFYYQPGTAFYPMGIASAGGDIWVTEQEPARILEISPAREMTEYALPGDPDQRKPQAIVAGPDGALWFIEEIGPDGKDYGIARLTPSGELSEVTVPGGGGVAGIAATNNAIYFTDDNGSGTGIMRIPLSSMVTPANASYVALGDSYSSGEGNPPFESGTDDEGIPDLCHRSDTAYGPLLDQALHLGPMSFKACSGATTNDIFAPSANNPSEPAQLDWLSQNTKLVTVTIGGNDAGFPWVLRHCVVWVPPLPNSFGCSTDAQLESETQARLAALAGGSYATAPPPQSQPIHSILSVIQAIHNHAKAARIVIGLYPSLFGPSKKHYAFTLAPGFAACEVGSILGDALWIGYEDAQWLNARGEQLNQIIMDAVADAAHQGIAVTYAPAQFAHHGLCDKSASWFHPLTLEINHLPELEPELPSGTPGSFHPTETGQQLGYEKAFVKKLH